VKGATGRNACGNTLRQGIRIQTSREGPRLRRAEIRKRIGKEKKGVHRGVMSGKGREKGQNLHRVTCEKREVDAVDVYNQKGQRDWGIVFTGIQGGGSFVERR